MFQPKWIKCLKCHARVNYKNLSKHQRKVHKGIPLKDIWNEYPVYEPSTRCMHITSTGNQCSRRKMDHYYCGDHLKSHGCMFADSDGSNRCGKEPYSRGYCFEHYNIAYLPIVKGIREEKRKNIAAYKPTPAQRTKPFIDYYEYIASPEWKERAKKARERAGYRCQICNTSDETLDVHHRTYERLGKEKDSDLTVLCRSCHTLFETKSNNRPSKRR